MSATSSWLWMFRCLCFIWNTMSTAVDPPTSPHPQSLLIIIFFGAALLLHNILVRNVMLFYVWWKISFFSRILEIGWIIFGCLYELYRCVLHSFLDLSFTKCARSLVLPIFGPFFSLLGSLLVKAVALFQNRLRLFQTPDAGVCATVRIQIQQKLVLTRNGFNAHLELDNGETTPLTNIAVEIIIRDFVSNELARDKFAIG